MARKLMLDTNIYDRIIARPGFIDRLNRAVESGAIEILRTRVQEEEIARIPDAAKRAAMRRVRSRLVPVGDDAWRGPHAPSEDAQIAASAAETADVLVSEDKELRARAGIETWDFAALVAFVAKLPA